MLKVGKHIPGFTIIIWFVLWDAVHQVHYVSNPALCATFTYSKSDKYNYVCKWLNVKKVIRSTKNISHVACALQKDRADCCRYMCFIWTRVLWTCYKSEMLLYTSIQLQSVFVFGFFVFLHDSLKCEWHTSVLQKRLYSCGVGAPIHGRRVWDFTSILYSLHWCLLTLPDLNCVSVSLKIIVCMLQHFKHTVDDLMKLLHHLRFCAFVYCFMIRFKLITFCPHAHFTLQVVVPREQVVSHAICLLHDVFLI